MVHVSKRSRFMSLRAFLSILESSAIPYTVEHTHDEDIVTFSIPKMPLLSGPPLTTEPLTNMLWGSEALLTTIEPIDPVLKYST